MSFKGKVYLAAAGPGDPDLVTVKTIKCLQVADVILVDRLVNKDIISLYANAAATVIDVGKQSGKEGSMPQQNINSMLLEYAMQYHKVVRLKGGDVSIFSNILDELEILVENGIEYEIIPGVTAALGASAYAGIPLTARGYASGVRLLTYHNAEGFSNKEWYDMGSTADTLVFYMASKKLEQLSAFLISNGMNREMPVAIVEQTTTPYQKVFITTLQKCIYSEKNYLSPAIVIIGKVVQLHEKFKWFQSLNKNVLFFDPVSDKSIIHNKENMSNAS